VTIKDGEAAWEAQPRQVFDADGLPLPETPSLAQPWNILFTGVGGTGVTTVAAVLAMAAHVDGNAASSLDMTGLAQKGGPVLSHIRFAREPEMISTGRVPPASADLVIACDLVVAAGGDALNLMDAGRTAAYANSDVTPTSEFIRDRSKRFESDLLSARVKRQASEFGAFDAEALAVGYLHEAIYTNMIMAGYAWQKGKVPVSLRGLYRAIRLNGTKVEDNMAAFNIGRIAAAAPERLAAQHDPRGHVEPKTLDELIEDRAARLTAYQNAAYADRYRAAVARVRAAEEKAGLGENLTRAAATYAYKLMAYKDEYEVARLYTDGKFAEQLASQFKGGNLRFWLAAPIIAKKDSHGHLQKKHFGAWMMTGFKVLAKFKGLRGTKLDLFGYTEERKMERALRDTYLRESGPSRQRTDRRKSCACRRDRQAARRNPRLRPREGSCCRKSEAQGSRPVGRLALGQAAESQDNADRGRRVEYPPPRRSSPRSAPRESGALFACSSERRDFHVDDLALLAHLPDFALDMLGLDRLRLGAGFLARIRRPPSG
jgi:indolepyruvate ferredoxin oxidoreductase